MNENPYRSPSLVEPDAPVESEMGSSEEESNTPDRFWIRYFYLHATIVLWIVASPIVGEFLVPAIATDFFRSFYFFTLAFTCPLVFLLPFVTVRLLVLSRLRFNKYLLLSVLDAVLCVTHFLGLLPACM